MSRVNFEEYPFEKLNKILKNIEPNLDYLPISLTIGEPKFETPKVILDALIEHANLLNRYPKSAGIEELKDAQIGFVKKRFDITLRDEQIVSTLGTREVLFNLPQFLLYGKESKKIAFTNPFYQIYEGAAIFANAKVEYINLEKENNFKPLINKEILKNCDVVILNFPNNPTGSILSLDELKEWVELALEFDFVLINDECYSEIYQNSPPHSILEASWASKNCDFKNILALNSISKRSSAPSLRSGFLAGDGEILKEYQKYRTYLGCAQPEPLQYASAVAWSDFKEASIIKDRYNTNRDIAREILNIEIPNETFYIWLDVGDDIEFTKMCYKNYNLKVLPGRFLGREGLGEGYVRVALVEEKERLSEALKRLSLAIKGIS